MATLLAQHDLLRALCACGESTRWRILTYLKTEGSCCVCELNAVFELPQSTLSSQLKKLLLAGLIECEKRGTWNYYQASAAAKQLLFLLEKSDFAPSAELRSQMLSDLKSDQKSDQNHCKNPALADKGCL